MKLSGPFAVQPGNNSTREFEYPWVFENADLGSNKTIVELGGSLAGMQFVLSRQGHRVINVDPGMEAAGLGWEVNPESIARLNQMFGTNVRLENTTLDAAGLPDESVDLILSVSVLEHLVDAELGEVMRQARRVLRSGGRFVITLDLFLNLHPFTRRESNEYGSNKNVRELTEASGMTLVVGDRSELYGFPEFDPERILSNLERYLVGSYPVLTQCIVLQKP